MRNPSILKRIFFIRSNEDSFCPVCCSALSVRGSKNRKVIKGDGSKMIYRLRVLKCDKCRKHHVELPDFIQPFKHHESETIESVLDDTAISCSAEESTLKRWRLWFYENYNRVDSTLTSIWISGHRVHVNLLQRTSLLQNIRNTGVGWLRAVMRQLVNSGKYTHNQFAFCPDAI